MCGAAVRFLMKHDIREQTLRFASLDSDFAHALRASHPELEGQDSVLWVQHSESSDAPSTQVKVRSEAVLAALRYLGGIWAPLARVGGWVPRSVRDGLYDALARRRAKISSRAGLSCVVPEPHTRHRFLESPSDTESA